MVERTASPRSPLQTQKPILEATLLIDGRGAPRSGSPGRSGLLGESMSETVASARCGAPRATRPRPSLRTSIHRPIFPPSQLYCLTHPRFALIYHSFDREYLKREAGNSRNLVSMGALFDACLGQTGYPRSPGRLCLLVNHWLRHFARCATRQAGTTGDLGEDIPVGLRREPGVGRPRAAARVSHAKRNKAEARAGKHLVPERHGSELVPVPLWHDPDLGRGNGCPFAAPTADRRADARVVIRRAVRATPLQPQSAESVGSRRFLAGSTAVVSNQPGISQTPISGQQE